MKLGVSVLLMTSLLCVVEIGVAGEQTPSLRDGSYILSSQASMEKGQQLFCPTPKVYIAASGMCRSVSNEVKDTPPIPAQGVLDKVFGSGMVKLSKVEPLDFDRSVSKLYYRVTQN